MKVGVPELGDVLRTEQGVGVLRTECLLGDAGGSALFSPGGKKEEGGGLASTDGR